MSETDESGTTQYVYDAEGRYPTTTILPDGEAITSEYNELGQLDVFVSDGERSEIELDVLGRTTRALYDTEEAHGDTLIVEYGYDSNSDAAVDNGLAADWTTIDSASTGKITRKLSPSGQLAGWVNEDGTETTYTYDNGRLHRETVSIPDGQGGMLEVSKTRYEYDEAGRVYRVTDEIRGVYTGTSYDKLGRKLTSEMWDENAMMLMYSMDHTYESALDEYAAGPIQVSDSLDAMTQFGYFLPGDTDNPLGPNSDRRVTTQTELLNAGIDQIVGNADDELRTSQVEYNAAGMPVAIVNPDGSRRTIIYRNNDVLGDAEQYPVAIIDEAGRRRGFTYTDEGRLATASDLAGNKLAVSYDADQRLGTITLPDTGTTGGDQLTVTYGYDDEDRVNTITRPGLGTTTIHRFGEAGDPELIELPHGDFVQYTYDDRSDTTPDLNTGRLSKREVIAGGSLTTVNGERQLTGGTALESFSYTYAPHGQVQAITNDLDQTATTYTYEYQTGDPARPMTTRLARVDLPNGTAVGYNYDAMDRVTKQTSYTSPSDTTGFVTEYAYDPAGRVTHVWDPNNPKGGVGSTPTTYTYDLAGRLSERLLPNGIRTTWTFGRRDRVLLLEHYETNTAAVVDSFTYWYTDDGQPSTTSGSEPRRITRADGSYVAYAYDAALRLTQETHVDDQGATVKTIGYAYDTAGNRTSRTVDGAGEDYASASDSAYKLDKVTDPSGGGATLRDYTTDSAGRVTGIDGATLSYNAAGQLTGYNGTTYRYDASGQRIGVNDGTPTHYAVAPSAQGLGLPLGLRYLATDGTAANSTAYIYAGENPIARHTSSGTEYYLEDATDSVRALTSSTGSVTQSYDYDAFGNVLSGSDPPELGYHAAWHDRATGLIDMRLRSYDPLTGRFTSIDPVAPDPTIYESFNPYTFANQNPMLYSDPTGGFSLAEINITQGLSKTLSGLKQAGIQHARNEAKDALLELATQALISSITGLVPGIGNTIQGLTTFADTAGNLFTSKVQSLFEEDGPLGELAEYARFEVPIDYRSGNPTGDGFGGQDSERDSVSNLKVAGKTSRLKPIRPDIIWGPPDVVGSLGNLQGGGTSSSKSFVITELKLTLNRLQKDAKTGSNQFKGFKYYTYNHTQNTKVISFLILLSGDKRSKNTSAKVERIKKKINTKFGLQAVVVTLINAPSPFSGR